MLLKKKKKIKKKKKKDWIGMESYNVGVTNN